MKPFAACLIALLTTTALLASDQQPTASDQRPATSDQQPTASDQRPATSDEQPAASDQKPANGPSVELTAQPAEVAVGDSVTVTITYQWPATWSVEPKPDPSADFRDTFVTAAPPARDTSTAESRRRVVVMTLAATRSGAWALPRPTLTASGPQGVVTVTASPVIVQVGTSSAPAHLPEPIALRLQAPPMAVNSWPWWIAAVVAAMALLIALLWRRRATATAERSPAELFAEETKRALGVSDGKDLGALLSLALRRYLGVIWKFDGAGSTVREVAVALARAGVADGERRVALRLLERLDDLRWSAADLPADQVRPLLAEATGLVEQIEARLRAEALAAAAAKSSSSSSTSTGPSAPVPVESRR
jgi:hypothetical protein